MNTSVNSASLASLLDSDLSDLADLASFEPFPAGVYFANVVIAVKEINGVAAVEFDVKYVETVDMADPTAMSPKVGDRCSTLYRMDNEYAQGFLKQHLKSMSAVLGVTKLGDIAAASKGMTWAVTTDIRTDKTDPDKKYLQIKKISAA